MSAPETVRSSTPPRSTHPPSHSDAHSEPPEQLHYRPAQAQLSAAASELHLPISPSSSTVSGGEAVETVAPPQPSVESESVTIPWSPALGRLTEPQSVTAHGLGVPHLDLVSSEPPPPTTPPPVDEKAPPSSSQLSVATDLAGFGSGVREHSRLAGRLPQIALLWVLTASIPSVVIWLAMRQPDHSDPECGCPRSDDAGGHTTPFAVTPVLQTGAPASNPLVPRTSGIEADASAPLPPSSSQVVSLTDAGDRVRVRVQSRPSGARLYRLGREFARTPITIEIARGDRRVFEVGTPSLGTRRIAIDGTKPEIMVTLAADPPPLSPAQSPGPVDPNG